MTVESTDAQLARIDERLKVIVEELSQARMGRKKQYEETEKNTLTIQDLANRLSNVEDSISRNAPTIEEFITIKHKVVGAGNLGKYLWIIGSFILGVAFSVRTQIADMIK